MYFRTPWSIFILTVTNHNLDMSFFQILIRLHGIPYAIYSKPLLVATYFGELEFVKFILENMEKIDMIQQPFKSHPIHIAAIKGHLEILKLLINFGVSPNTVAFGWTPIQYAVKFEQAEIVEYLAPITTHPNSVNPKGHTPFQVAAAKGNVEILRLLLPFSDNPNAPCICGWTPIQKAVRKGRAKIVKILAPFTQNPNAALPLIGQTPIQYASGVKGYTDIVKELIPYTEHPNAKDQFNWTPFQNAVYFGHTDIVKLLAPEINNHNAINPLGKTSIQEAKSKGYTEIVEILTTYSTKKAKCSEKSVSKPKAKKFVFKPRVKQVVSKPKVNNPFVSGPYDENIKEHNDLCCIYFVVTMFILLFICAFEQD